MAQGAGLAKEHKTQGKKNRDHVNNLNIHKEVQKEGEGQKTIRRKDNNIYKIQIV